MAPDLPLFFANNVKRKDNAMKVCEDCGVEIYTKDGGNKCPTCEDRAADGKKPATQARRKRSGIDQAMRDLGLVKVRGVLGGTYWE